MQTILSISLSVTRCGETIWMLEIVFQQTSDGKFDLGVCVCVCVAYKNIPTETVTINFCIHLHIPSFSLVASFFGGWREAHVPYDISTKQITCKTFTASPPPFARWLNIFDILKRCFLPPVTDSNIRCALLMYMVFFHHYFPWSDFAIHLPFVVSLIW